MEICKEIVQIFFQYVINLIDNIQLLFYSLNRDNIQLMTFHKVDTVIYQPQGSDVH